MKEFLTKLPLFLILLFIGTVFFIKGSIFLDPDFGWHFKMGELIVKQGIPNTDPFSYTMSSFPFVDHEWLTSVIYYYLYQTTGMNGLALIFLAIGIIIVLILKSQNRSKFFLGPFLLSAAIVSPFWAVRPQIETLLLTAILLKVIGDDNLWTKWKWLSPLYFLVWSNLHGGFPLGLVIIFIALIFKSIAKKRVGVSDIILTLFCLGATLINPYGFNLWKEIWQQLSDGNLRWTVIEWHPLILSSNWAFLSFTPLFVLSFSLIVYFRSKLTHFQISLYILLLLASLSSQRHTPIWILVTLPLTVQALNMFYKKIKYIKYAQTKFKTAYRILVISSFVFFSFQTVTTLQLKELGEDKYYPKQAVNFLKQYPQNIRIFNEYGWGGYLIWKLPEKKVFVDGRMPSWRYKNAPAEESQSAFDDYNKVLTNPEGIKVLDKYQVMYVLWPQEVSPKKNLKQKILNWEREILSKLFNIPTPLPLGKRLEKTGWKTVYQDQVAIIYQRP